MKDILDCSLLAHNTFGIEARCRRFLEFETVDEARQVAEDRMIEQAQRLGADAILAMRFDSGSIQPGTIEMIAYGTAVKFN